ncbi:MAG TPA: hypothetical protein DCP63_03880 [Bacteroidetes bacterium]|nr:hypothetical protein [Bacteroidota bacterium]
MRNSYLQEKLHRRGSTPHQGTQQALEDSPYERMSAMPTELSGGVIQGWAEGFQPLDQIPECPIAIQPTDYRMDSNRETTPQESSSLRA